MEPFTKEEIHYDHTDKDEGADSTPVLVKTMGKDFHKFFHTDEDALEEERYLIERRDQEMEQDA